MFLHGRSVTRKTQIEGDQEDCQIIPKSESKNMNFEKLSAGIAANYAWRGVETRWNCFKKMLVMAMSRKNQTVKRERCPRRQSGSYQPFDNIQGSSDIFGNIHREIMANPTHPLPRFTPQKIQSSRGPSWIHLGLHAASPKVAIQINRHEKRRVAILMHIKRTENGITRENQRPQYLHIR